MAKPMLAEKDYLTLAETATLFNLSRRKFFRQMSEGHYPFIAMYGKRKLVLREEFQKYLNEPGVKEELANGEPKTKKRR